MIFLEYVGSRACLSAGKNYKTKKIPCKLILYGGGCFWCMANKHITCNGLYFYKDHFVF